LQSSKGILKVIWLVLTSFIAKIVVEILHEGGHCLVALLTSGHIEEVHISLLWPYKSSYVIANVGGFPANLLFEVAGITVVILSCYIVMFIVLPRIRNVDAKLLAIIYPFLVWFTFWSFLNSIGYMVLGAFKPFGDIKAIAAILKIKSSIFLPIAIILAVPLILRISDENSKMLEFLFPSLIDKKWIGPLIWIFIVPLTTLIIIPGSSYNLDIGFVLFLILLLMSCLPFLFSILICYVFRD